LVEVYQNCNVFNDGAFEDITSKDNRASMLINLRHGEQIRFGKDLEYGVVRNDDGSVSTALIGADNEQRLVVHDEHVESPTHAFALSRLTRSDHEPTPMGVFRDVDAAEYGDLVSGQIAQAQIDKGQGDLHALFRSNGSWTVQ
jgi:2-oxoglutarate ferredoxin oxidoreductase subunit beta